MLISAEIHHDFYCETLGKNLEVNAKGTVVIGRNLNPTSGNHFSQEIHVENLETSHEVQKVIALDKDFHETILIQLIKDAMDQLEDCFACDEYMNKL